MREGGVRARVVRHVDGLVTDDRWFEVDQHAVLERGVDRRIADRPDREARRLARADVEAGGEVDVDAEVDADLPDGVRQIGEGIAAVAAGVAEDDIAAAAEHHLVQAQVLEVTAVGQEHVRIGEGGPGEQFVDERLDAECRRRARPGRVAGHAGIAEPDAQPRVEHGQQERHRARRIGAHVRADRGARGRQRLAERDPRRICRRGPIAELPRSGMERAHRERRRLALGDCQAIVGHEVQRGVDDVQGTADVRGRGRTACRRPHRSR